jgi:hypothetical protein
MIIYKDFKYRWSNYDNDRICLLLNLEIIIIRMKFGCFKSCTDIFNPNKKPRNKGHLD